MMMMMEGAGVAGLSWKLGKPAAIVYDILRK